MWSTAIILGFAGSMHCLGMCSPLVMAVTLARPSALLNRILYNTGRLAVYGCMGAIVSGAGTMLPARGWQDLFSVTLGVILLLAGVGAIRRMDVPVVTRVLQHLSAFLKGLFGRYLQHKNRMSMLLLGALNGLLPCGLTFVALTWCLTLRGPLDGLNFMLLFGAGTLPAMLGMAGIMKRISGKLHWNIRSVTTALLVVSGSLLILRVFLVHIPQAASGHHTLIDILCR